MEDLQKQLNERNSLNKPRLEEGSPEREAIAQKLSERQRFDKFIREELSKDFDINSSLQLGERIRALRKQYPDDFESHIREIERSRASQQQQEGQAAQQASGQGSQSWQTQTKQLTPEKPVEPDRSTTQESRDTTQEWKQRIHAWADKTIEEQRKKFEKVWEGLLPWRGQKP